MNMYSFDSFVTDEKQVFRPKPIRIGTAANDSPHLFRIHLSHRSDSTESEIRSEFLDLILEKDLAEPERFEPPPYFFGSPPTRSSNPLVKDARFGSLNATELPGVLTVSTPPGLTTGRLGFGPTQPAVRVEGFNCLNRERARVAAMA